jgi:hypothetical protein
MILCDGDAPEGNPGKCAHIYMLSYPIIVTHLSFNFLCLLLLYSIYLNVPASQCTHTNMHPISPMLVSYRRLSPQFQFSLSAVTLLYISISVICPQSSKTVFMNMIKRVDSLSRLFPAFLCFKYRRWSFLGALGNHSDALRQKNFPREQTRDVFNFLTFFRKIFVINLFYYVTIQKRLR